MRTHLPVALTVAGSDSGGEVLASLIIFTLLYGILAVIEAGLMLKYIKAGLTSAS